MPDLEKAVQQLNDALIVSASIQERHTQLLGEHAEMIHGIHKALIAQNKAMLTQIEHLEEHRQEHDRLSAETEEFRRRTDQNLAEITDKLNGLIGYVSGIKPPPQ